MKKQIASMLVASVLFLATAWAQVGQQDGTTASRNTSVPRPPSADRCRFESSNDCDFRIRYNQQPIYLPPPNARRNPYPFAPSSGCHRTRHMLIATLAGAGIGASIGAAGDPKKTGPRGSGAMLGGALFGLIGWGIGNLSACSH